MSIHCYRVTSDLRFHVPFWLNLPFLIEGSSCAVVVCQTNSITKCFSSLSQFKKHFMRFVNVHLVRAMYGKYTYVLPYKSNCIVVLAV